MDTRRNRKEVTFHILQTDAISEDKISVLPVVHDIMYDCVDHYVVW